MISGRHSDRTPFGTGATLSKHQNQELLFYHPQVFEELKKHLKTYSLDALQTLQFVHQQQKIWPDLSFNEALSSAKFLEHLNL